MRDFFEGNTVFASFARADRTLMVVSCLLLAFGILMVFSTTAVLAEEQYGDSFCLVQRHVLSVLAGLVALSVFFQVPPELLLRFSRALLCVGFVLMVLVFLPGMGRTSGGAKRWIEVGGLGFQPGELVKMILVLYFSSYIKRREDQMHRLVPGTLIPCGILAVFAVLFLMQPDFGTTVVVLLVVFLQLATAARLRHLFAVGVLSLGVIAPLILTSGYRMRRVLSFLDPFQDPEASGYQLIQSLIAVGSGGVTGTGLGVGEQKLFYLPAAHTDFIYAVIAEEWGLMGAVGVLLLFLILAQRGLSIAWRLSHDAYLSSLALGATMLLVVPAFLNMGVVLGLLPTKGMVLPFIAYGGTAMVMHLAVLGVLFKLSTMADD